MRQIGVRRTELLGGAHASTTVEDGGENGIESGGIRKVCKQLAGCRSTEQGGSARGCGGLFRWRRQERGGGILWLCCVQLACAVRWYLLISSCVSRVRVSMLGSGSA